MNSKFPRQILNALPIFDIILNFFLSSNMANLTNQHQATTGSLLSRLMAKTSAGAADVVTFVFDDKDEASSLLCQDGRDDDPDSTASSTFRNWWNWRGGNNHAVQTVEEKAEEVHASPVQKKTRIVHKRKPQAESTWLRDYLNPTLWKRCKQVLHIVSSSS